MIATQDDNAKIIQRMEELRSMGVREVDRLHAQAERITDWREHVKSRPVLSTLAAALIGYAVVKPFVGKSAAKSPLAPVPQYVSGSRPSAASGLLTVAGGIVSTIARKWATEFIRRKLGGDSNGTQSGSYRATVAYYKILSCEANSNRQTRSQLPAKNLRSYSLRNQEHYC